MNKKSILVVIVIGFILYMVSTGGKCGCANKREVSENKMMYAGAELEYITDPRDPRFKTIGTLGNKIFVPDADGYLMRPSIDSGFVF